MLNGELMGDVMRTGADNFPEAVADVPQIDDLEHETDFGIIREDAREDDDEFSRLTVSQYRAESEQTAEMINRDLSAALLLSSRAHNVFCLQPPLSETA